MQADDLERLVEIPQRDTGFVEADLIRIACRAGLRAVVPPCAAAQHPLLDVVEFGEPGSDTRLDRTLAQQARTEGVDRPGKESLY